MSTFAERQRARQERMTPEQIVKMANKHGQFSVSLRWRDDWLRSRCSKLVKAGLLRKQRGISGGCVIFVPVAQDQAMKGDGK